jgi:hypothetical protein
MSWALFLSNAVAILTVAFVTYPHKVDGEFGFLLELVLRVVMCAIFAAPVIGYFYKKSRYDNRFPLRRYFVIGTWIFLGLLVLSEM